VHHCFPAQLALIVPKLNFIVGQFAVLGFKLVLLELWRIQANVFLPAAKIINPIIEIGNSEPVDPPSRAEAFRLPRPTSSAAIQWPGA